MRYCSTLAFTSAFLISASHFSCQYPARSWRAFLVTSCCRSLSDPFPKVIPEKSRYGTSFPLSINWSFVFIPRVSVKPSTLRAADARIFLPRLAYFSALNFSISPVMFLIASRFPSLRACSRSWSNFSTHFAYVYGQYCCVFADT